MKEDTTKNISYLDRNQDKRRTVFAIYEKGENTILVIGSKPFKLLLFFLSTIFTLTILILKAVIP